MKSIGLKISFGYFVIIFINVTISIFAIYYLNRLSSPIDEILEEKVKNVSASESMIQSLVQQELVQYEMMNVAYNEALVVKFDIYKNEFYNWHQRAIEGVSETMDVAVLDSVLNTFHVYLRHSAALQLQLATGMSKEEANAHHYSTIIPAVKKLESLCSKIIEQNREFIAQAEDQAAGLSDYARMMIIVFSLVAIMFSIIASYYFTKRVVKPIKRTISTVQKISKGQLNQKILISSNDEIAELGMEFNKMTERLYSYEQMNIEQLLTEKRKSEAIVASMPVSVLVTDDELNLSLLNEPAKELLDVSDSPGYGKPVAEIIKDPLLLKLISSPQVAGSGDFDPQKSIITITRDRKEKYLLARQVKIKGSSGNVTAIVTILHDVTQFKELDHQKSEFIAIISHQFKTPLTSIMLIVDILLKEVKGKLNKEQRELLGDARSDSQRLKEFVYNLLQFSKLETGKISFELTPIGAATAEKVLHHACEPLKPRLQEKDLDLNIIIPQNLRSFQGDEQQLSLVFANIIENSIQYTENGGWIRVEAAEKKDSVEFSISDNGEGIPADKIPFIFDKFVQAQEFQNDAHGSIGLGLAIAREIITAHGGEILVASKPGEGSTFTIRFPGV